MTSSPLKPHDTSLVRFEDFTHPTRVRGGNSVVRTHAPHALVGFPLSRQIDDFIAS